MLARIPKHLQTFRFSMRKESNMKNVRVKVRENCDSSWWDFGIFEGGKVLLMVNSHIKSWHTKKAAIRNAKAMAKRIGIPYSDEIIKQHGC